jgi:hypothetical protein
MPEKVIFAAFVCVIVLVFNWILFRGMRKSRRTTRMFKIDQLYAKYEEVDQKR